MHPLIDRAVSSKSLVFIVGTGVSAAVTQGAPTATWMGLLRSGVQRVIDRGLEPNAQWEGLITSLIGYSEVNSDTNSLLLAAGMLRKTLEGHGSGPFADWLQADVGELVVRDAAAARAITDLPFPILTTNYDKLLEKVGQRGTASWQRPRELHDVVTGKEADIGHLHGVYNDISSIVLTEQDYERHANSAGVQALERAISAVKTVVYVGFGSGLSDPNFAALLAWHRQVFSESTTQHVRLCLESEVQGLQKAHADDRIEPVAYGSVHEDLAKYLRALAEPARSLAKTGAGIVRDAVAEAREQFGAQLRAETVISESFGESGNLSNVPLLPPAILPVPHAQYAKMRSDPASAANKATIARCDPDDEIVAKGILLLVGEDEAGLTTTLKWLAWRAANHFGVTPLYVNFRECHTGRNPLLSRIRMAARESGISASRRDELPDYVLVVDDLSPFTAVSDAVLDDLSSTGAGLALLGCKQGVEDELTKALEARGLEVRVRFVGRVRSSDVEELARAIAPGRAESLTKQVVDLLLSANLPRTPLTVSLLMVILLRGGSIRPSASQTQILEQYVAELLGRGDPLEDARVAVDPTDRELALSHLAAYFVNNETSRIRGSEALSVFESVFDTYSWSESPAVLLSSLVTRRVLKQVGQHIEFSQTFYLYLFAAKHAMSNTVFLEKLKEKPRFYAPIISSYAALRRNDEQLVEHLRERFVAAALVVEPGNSFSTVDIVEMSEEDALEADVDEPEEGTINPVSTRPISEHFDILDSADESRVDLFLLEENIPETLLYWRNLELLSSVLRDSDHIANLELKQATLVTAIDGWGNLLNVLENDRTFREAIDGLMEKLVESSGYEGEDDFLRKFADFMPALIVISGMDDSLSTRKLLKVLSAAVATRSLESNEGAIGGALLLYLIQERGWVAQLRLLIEGRMQTWVVQEFLATLLMDAYMRTQTDESADTQALLDLCLELHTTPMHFPSDRARKAYLAAYRTNMQKHRRMTQGKLKEFALGKGEGQPLED